MKKKKLILKILLALALGTAPAYAAELPSYDMEEIVVVADAHRSPITENTVNVKVVSPGRAANIPELLRQSAGIDIQMRSFAGDNQDGTVKLRGFDSRRYTVMLNGRQISSAGVMGGQYIDWNTIPLNTVEKIQIIKGAKLASQGNTLGGVINIITRDKGPDGGEINILSGENGQYNYLFNYAGNADKLHFQITGNKIGADAFLRNNDYDAEQYGIRLNYEANKQDSFVFGVNKTEAKRGFIMANKPGMPGYDPNYPVSDGELLSPNNYAPLPGSYWEKKNTYYDFNYKHAQTNGYWQFDYYKNNETRREVNLDSNGDGLDRTIPSDKSDYFGISGKQTIEGHTYGYGVDYKRLRYGYGWHAVNDVGDSAIYPSQKVDLFGTYVDDTWQLNKRWNAYLGLRYDSFSGSKDDSTAVNMRDSDYSSLSPKLNLSFKNNTDTTTYISVNRLWRAPSMAEYYWWSRNYTKQFPAGPTRPNPSYQKDIKPEHGLSYEVGTEHRFNDSYTSKITLFYQDISDYLSFQHAYPFFCYNIDQANIWGAEWENSLKLSNTSKVFINYTNQHTKKVGVSASDTLGLSNELDYRPRHKVSLSYLYDARPWQVRYTANYVSSQLDGMYSQGSTIHIGGYTVHNIAVTRTLDEQRAITLYVDNLFDKEYVEQYNYPMAGRLCSIGYNQRF